MKKTINMKEKSLSNAKLHSLKAQGILTLKKRLKIMMRNALKASCSKSHAFLIDSRASNHMVASRESFSSLQTTDNPSIHMGDIPKFELKERVLSS